ncbi:MAG: hypothetical protein IBJ10_04740 [Phycisphaerales bacterium]|nr:hypothetical protein [Phycisphaerales bacterium]
MAGIVKTVVRFGVIAGLGTGVAVLVAGPERVAAVASSARDKALSCIDSHIDDPTIIRAQLRAIEAKYPQRIADVRGDLAELKEQMRQIDREKSVSERVVALADTDLVKLKDMLARAEAARSSSGPGRAVLVSFNNQDLPLEQAYSRATQISQTKSAYAARAADADRTLAYLDQQAERLQQLLTKLEGEHADFQTQLWQLDHQVDAIARNDRLLDMLEKRQKMIDDRSRYEVVSLEQVNSRLAQIRTKQEAQFEALDKAADRLNYEDVAAQQVEAEKAAKAQFERSLQTAPSAPAPILIGPDDGSEDAAKPAPSVASSEPVRIR